MVRDGHAEPRVVTTGAGAIEAQAPRVNDRRSDPETGQRCRFRSSILPPWARKSPRVAEVLPLMYLHGMSTGDFAPALGEFFGSAAGLSPSVITRLTTQWQDERRAFANRCLDDVDYVYVWVDGIHFNIRLEEERLCALVVVGVRADGTKELVAIADGYRESTEAWADLLRDLRRRGTRAPAIPRIRPLLESVPLDLGPGAVHIPRSRAASAMLRFATRTVCGQPTTYLGGGSWSTGRRGFDTSVGGPTWGRRRRAAVGLLAMRPRRSTCGIGSLSQALG